MHELALRFSSFCQKYPVHFSGDVVCLGKQDRSCKFLDQACKVLDFCHLAPKEKNPALFPCPLPKRLKVKLITFSSKTRGLEKTIL